jgi:hypothetical protein
LRDLEDIPPEPMVANELWHAMVSASAYDALLAERDAMAKDAGRYRWLRGISTDRESLEAGGYKLPFIAVLFTGRDEDGALITWPTWKRTVGDDADAAIDAALAASSPEAIGARASGNEPEAKEYP